MGTKLFLQIIILLCFVVGVINAFTLNSEGLWCLGGFGFGIGLLLFMAAYGMDD